MQVSGTPTPSKQTEEPGFLLSLQSAYPWPVILNIKFLHTILASPPLVCYGPLVGNTAVVKF